MPKRMSQPTVALGSAGARPGLLAPQVTRPKASSAPASSEAKGEKPRARLWHFSPGTKKGSWMDEIRSHHLENNSKPLFVGI